MNEHASIKIGVDYKQLNLEKETKLNNWFNENATGWSFELTSYADTDKIIKGTNYKLIVLHDNSVIFQGYNMGFFNSNLYKKPQSIKNLLDLITSPTQD